ncbi:MAG TPA: aminomethyl-transferring glycine dehydrogenase subunit GcvPB, partial [Anaerolineae bacterium]|nr:aminomethyl-transferring glycine dehydrogenase subunit GcvPB [Anaerolineae bacterium]
EISRPDRSSCRLPELDVPEAELPAGYGREELPLPEVSEIDLMRHYVRLSQLNHAVDTGFYPLGSCTMKYNPKVNEAMSRLPGFVQLHPLQPSESVQGAMEVMYGLQGFLGEISGFPAVSLQPAAGAHGELTGVLIMRKALYDRGETQRNVILVPDSAHGTNPATTTMSGLQVVEIPSDDRGNVDLDALRSHLDDRVVGLMLTNPNTLGLFDENVLEVTRLVHEAGGLVYGDGANLNALLGICKPAKLGFDVLHFNLHKTFSTPHGGGGPGAGPVGVTAELSPFLPSPLVVAREDDEGPFLAWHTPAKSIGPVKSFYGNFGVLVRAYTYIRMLGGPGLRRVAENAVLNANYLLSLVRDIYPLPYDRSCMHEFVIEGRIEGAPDVRALDISKRLMDYGFHPPTNYFPLIVPEALMIEPTETESKETLDAFAEALASIAEEARTDPDLLHNAPHTTPLSRMDEVRASHPRTRRLCYAPGC